MELKGLHSNFEDVKLEPKPAYGEVTPSQAQTEPQLYVEFVAIGGVTSDSVAMEESPAYQSVDTAVSQQTEELFRLLSLHRMSDQYMSIATTVRATTV